ncbi:MAG: HEAT repeat domain-containing protein [Cyanobacteriota bacterium]|nr:HEAT repeat domain-containing protein [Cyanobacteriota bacterium]
MTPQTLIDAVRQADTAQALLQAAQALAAAAGPSSPPEAIQTLVELLGYNNPGAAVAAVDGLIAIGPAAVLPLLDGLDEHNYGARAWAVRALAGIGDVRGLELLESALGNDIGPSVRRAAACGLGQLQCEALPEQERETIRQRCLAALEGSLGDGEWVVRYAVAVALERLAAPLPGSTIQRRACLALEQLAAAAGEDAEVVRQRAALALQRLTAAQATR